LTEEIKVSLNCGLFNFGLSSKNNNILSSRPSLCLLQSIQEVQMEEMEEMDLGIIFNIQETKKHLQTFFEGTLPPNKKNL